MTHFSFRSLQVKINVELLCGLLENIGEKIHLQGNRALTGRRAEKMAHLSFRNLEVKINVEILWGLLENIGEKI